MAPKKKLSGLSKDESMATGMFSLDDLAEFRTSIRKEFGDSAGIDDDDFITSFISTGIDALDYYLGGGIPVGKPCEVAGREGTGKSSFGIHMMAQIQKQNGLCALIDTEVGGAGDRFRFQHFGVDPAKCLISEEDKAEKVFSIIEKTANFVVQKRLTVPSLIVVDSVAGLTTAAELEAAMDTQQFAAVPRMIGKGIRKVKTICRESGITVLFVNQSRVKIGGMTNMYTGPEMTTPGGDALKFAAITRLFMERGATIKDKASQLPIGHIVKTKFIKCKTSAALNRTLPMAFFYDQRGYYNPKIVYDMLCDTKVLQNSAWKSVVLPDGTEKRFNSEDVFFDLFEASEENRLHFVNLMKQGFQNSLSFGNDANDTVNDSNHTDLTPLFESSSED